MNVPGYTTKHGVRRELQITCDRLERAIANREVRTILAGTKMVLVNLADVRRIVGMPDGEPQSSPE